MHRSLYLQPLTAQIMSLVLGGAWAAESFDVFLHDLAPAWGDCKWILEWGRAEH